MTDVHLKLVEATPPPDSSWKAELWSGGPESSSRARLAGGTQAFTQLDFERDGTFQHVVQKLDLATVLDKIRTDEGPDLIFFPAMGLRLFEMLTKAGVGQEWLKLRSGDGVRTYLEVPPSLAAWPWELLASEAAPNILRHAFNDSLNPVLRVSSPFQSGLKWTDSLVRILLVSGQEILDPATGYKASQELRLIRRIFHQSGLSVLVELCEAPGTAQQLENRITAFKPHILHFIGHGDLEEQAPGAEYALHFDDKLEPAWEWSVGQLFQFFSNHVWKPRLVILNACHSGQYDQGAASLADALIAAGIPAVIGAQAALRVDYARHFSEAFYGALAAEDRPSLDKAMVSARATLSTKPEYNGLKRRHWALPILRVSAPVEEILRFRSANAEVTSCEVVKEVFSRPGRFVDRTGDRWAMVSRLAPALPNEPAYRGLILQGGSRLGKCWLVKRVVRDFVDAGFWVRYATLSSPAARRNSLNVLEDWRGRANTTSYLLRPADGPHFDLFDAAVAQAAISPSADATRAAFAAFKTGLQSARQGQKVLLILDRFRQKGYATVTPGDFREGLMQQLLLPIQAQEQTVDGIYALLVIRAQDSSEAPPEFETYGIEQLSAFYKHQISAVMLSDLGNVLDEFTNFRSNESLDHLRQAFEAMVTPKGISPQDARKTPWSLDRLAAINEAVVAFQNDH